MNKLLLPASLVFISHFAFCQTSGGAAKPASSKKITHHAKHHAKHHTKQKKAEQGEVIHYAPGQDKIDSIKRAKQKMVH